MEELVYIFGAGGHARELSAYVEDLRRAGWDGRVVGWLDDGLTVGTHGRLRVLGGIEELEGLKGLYITAFGSNALRRDIVARIEARYGRGLASWTLCHPCAYLGQDVEIGEGTCIAPGVILTASIRLGRHCIVNVNASVSHDCAISDFVNINPRAVICGGVTIGEGAYIGAGAVLKDRVTVGAWSVIGAGAVVVEDMPPHVTAIGVPARPVRVSS